MPDPIYTPPFKPYAHQQATLEKMRGKEAFALLLAMRCGKSKVLLDDYGRLELEGKAQNLCVIAPGGVIRTWITACADHLSADLKSRARVALWESGANATKTKALAAFMANAQSPRIFLVNVEALSSVPKARETTLAFLQAGTCVLAIDEATVGKNPSSARTKFMNQKLAPHAEYRRILSGLLTPKSPLDVYAPFEFLSWRILGHRSYFSFRARHAVMVQMTAGGRTFAVVKGYRDLDVIQQRIAPYSSRVLLEDCYDLPEKIYQIREVTLTDEQKRIYKEMKEFATAELSSGTFATATQVIVQLIKLHQVLMGHVTDEVGNVQDIPENRTAALIELLHEVDDDQKVICWCSYDLDVRRVSAALQEEFGPWTVARFWGGNRSTREEEERRFLHDSETRFMVATAAAGGRGRTWTVADMTVYFSNSPDLEHRSQSEERTQGVGKTRAGLYVDLVAPGTVDDKFIHALRAKIDLAATITGDSWREWVV